MKSLFFILFILTTYALISCDSGSYNQKNKGLKNKNATNLENLMQNDNSSTIPTKEEKKLKEKAAKYEKQLLITSLKKRVQKVISLVYQDKINIKTNEPADQFGMKNGTFKNIMGNPSQQTYNSNKGQENRRQFYSSLGYNKEQIRKLGIILNDITFDNINRGKLHTTITNAGRYHSQFQFERIINKINEIQNKLHNLNLKDLRIITIKLDRIEMLKLLWKNTVYNIIKDYENNQNRIQTDSHKLIKHIKEKYENILKKEIPKIDTLANDINKILKILN